MLQKNDVRHVTSANAVELQSLRGHLRRKASASVDSLNILPIDQTLSFIQALTTTTWPLTREQVHECAAQVGWDLDMEKEHSWYQSFEISPDIDGSMTLHSYGVPNLYFRVSEAARGEDKDEKITLLSAHMKTLENELTALYGQPFSFTDEESKEEIRWWKLSSGMWLKINYGTPHPEVAITCPRHPSEPKDLIAVPTMQECLRTIQTWLDASWPLPVSTVHNLANSLGWNPEDQSSSEFFSTLPYVFFEKHPPFYSEDFSAEPDVYLTYGQRGARKISFSLADHWSMRTEAEAWPLIQERMLEVETALSASYGPPETGTIRGNRHYAKWAVTPHLSLTIYRAPGVSDVTIEYLESQETHTTGVPITYGLDEVLHIIDEWTQAMAMGPIDLFDAAEIATGIGWFPENTDWPDTYYTQVSPPAQPRAAIRDENQQVWLVTFDVAMGVDEHVPGRSASDIEHAMTTLEAALSERYGAAETSTHYGGQYRDWDTGHGVRVRLSYGLGMSSVWIYDPAKKATVETFITRPEGVTDETATSSSVARSVETLAFGGQSEASRDGAASPMPKIAFFLVFLAALGFILKYFLF